jgi:uncharacterized protein (TIRG00374 family)
VKRLLALLALSLGLGLAGLYLATRDALLDPNAYVPAALSGPKVLLFLACLVLLWGLPALKLQLLASSHGHRLKGYQAWLVHVANVFGVAMTPSGAGGGPGMMMALSRFGLPAGTALGVAVQVFVLDLAVFSLATPLALAYLLLGSAVSLPFRLELAALAAALAGAALAVVLLRWPRPAVRLLLGLGRLRWLGRLGPRLQAMAREYYRGVLALQGMSWGRWSLLLAVNAVTWAANFALFWVLLAIYGIATPAAAILGLLAVLTLVSFVVPTPGASGFMEFVVGLAMSGRVSSEAVAPAILIWRACTFYVAYLLGPIAGWAILLDRPPRWLSRLLRRRNHASGFDGRREGD